MAAVARFLVIQPAFLGDAVLTLPLIGNLRAKYPTHEIHWVLRKGVEPLLEGHPWITQLWVWDKSWSGWFRLLQRLRRQNWEAVLTAQRFLRSGLLGYLVPAQSRITYDKNPVSWLYSIRLPHQFREGVHEVDRLLALGEPLSLPSSPPAPPWLFLSEAARASVAPWTARTPYLIVSPTSRWRTKEAPLSLWRRFLEAIPPTYTVYLTGLASDKERLAYLEGYHPHTYNLAGKLSLQEVAALVEKAWRVYTVDSALTHISSALGTPTTTVFCSTIPEFGFGPLAPQSSVVETDTSLACRPCGLHGKTHCPLGHFACGETISVEKLLEPFQRSSSTSTS